jgi:hypothetical protein
MSGAEGPRLCFCRGAIIEDSGQQFEKLRAFRTARHVERGSLAAAFSALAIRSLASFRISRLLFPPA